MSELAAINLPKVRDSHKADCYMANCFLCSDTSGHVEVDTKKHLWHCFRCGRGGVVINNLLRTGSSASLRQIRPDIPDPESFYSVAETSKGWEYLMGRGFSATIIEALDPHRGPDKWMVYFPIRNREGRTVYQVGRSFYRGVKQRWWYPSGSPGKSHYLWGMHRAQENTELVLVEGIFDAVWDSNRIAIFGKSLSDTQLDLLRSLRPTSITIALDGDAYEDSKRLGTRIAKQYSIPVYVVRLRMGNELFDPNDLREKGVIFIDGERTLWA